MYIFNQSVLFKVANHKVQQEIDFFIKSFYTQESAKMQINNKIIESPSKTFAITFKDQWYLLHKNQFEHLKTYFDNIGIQVNMDECIDKTDYEYESIDLKIRPEFVARDYQKKIIDQIAEKQERNNLVPIQTGKGKTFIALSAVVRLKMRCAILILPTYIDKWISDITETLVTTDETINVVKGSVALADAITLAKDGEYNYDFTIFSLRTMQNYINDFIEDRQACIDMYGCSPLELIPLLKIGTLISDETHQHFHALFRVVICLNIRNIIGLSATLLAEDSALEKAHKALYPTDAVDSTMDYDRYAYVVALYYSIDPWNLQYVKTTIWRSTSYSHVAFEKSIMKDGRLRKNYLELIRSTIDNYYMKNRDPRDKILIFVSTIKFATLLVKFLVSKYPDFDVRRYCEADPYENLMDAQITVSTHMSAGTAVDIPNLRVCLQTVSVSSPVANLQSLGRLRKLPDRDVTYVYLYAQQLRKQVGYHRKRKEIFKPKALKFLEHKATRSL